MGSTQKDVIVVGAGPAGATVAYQLARAGAQVLILEKDRLPRYKTCGGGVTVKAARLLDFDISPVVERTITGVAFTSRMGREFTRRADEPLCYMVMRDRFDQFLVDRAREAGAALRDGCPVQKIEVDGPRVTLTTRQDETFTARLIVGADGANSAVARCSGLMRKVPVGIGLESEVRVDAEDLARWQDRLLLDLATIPRGYGWIFPKGDHLSIGVGGPAEDSTRIRGYFQEFTAFCQSFLGTYDVLHTQGHRLPVRGPGMPIHGPRSLLVGDAAGLVNPLDGEGIYYAIRSAQIAAPFIRQALSRSGAPDLAGYGRAIDEQLMPELRHAAWLMRLFSMAPPLFVRRLEKSERRWQAIAAVLRGDRHYTDLGRKLGPFLWVLGRLVTSER